MRMKGVLFLSVHIEWVETQNSKEESPPQQQRQHPLHLISDKFLLMYIEQFMCIMLPSNNRVFGAHPPIA